MIVQPDDDLHVCMGAAAGGLEAVVGESDCQHSFGISAATARGHPVSQGWAA
jgi:hypothetical protein